MAELWGVLMVLKIWLYFWVVSLCSYFWPSFWVADSPWIASNNVEGTPKARSILWLPIVLRTKSAALLLWISPPALGPNQVRLRRKDRRPRYR